MAWAKYRLRGALRVADEPVEVTGAVITFDLNSIPRATFGLAVGRRSGRRPAAVHRMLGRLEAGNPVTYSFDFSRQAGNSKRQPGSGRFQLFEGEVADGSWDKQTGNANLILNANHWLTRLNEGSALSASSHPQNPSEFSYRARHEFLAGSASWTPFTAAGLITTTTLASDFWKEGLLPWFQELAGEDRINTEELNFLGEPAGPNEEALSALARFSSGPGNYAPLAMDFADTDASSIADAIWNDVQLETYASFSSTTLWEKLIADFSARYLFAVVPRVRDAIVVPYMPMIRDVWKHVIEPQDILAVSYGRSLERLLRGVGIFAGLKSRTGADNREPGSDDAVRPGIGGWFSPQGMTRGMVSFRQGPRWLSNVIASDRYSEYSSGGGARPIGTALHPGAGSKPDIPTPRELKAKAKPIFDRFAQALYAYESLRARQISVTTPLRFDICPGSTVVLGVVGERFIPNDQASGALVGSVVRVSYNIDSENGRASTSFQLSHVRTIAENRRDAFSLERHPLWKNNWSGAGLIPEYD